MGSAVVEVLSAALSWGHLEAAVSRKGAKNSHAQVAECLRSLQEFIMSGCSLLHFTLGVLHSIFIVVFSDCYVEIQLHVHNMFDPYGVGWLRWGPLLPGLDPYGICVG